MFAMALNWKDQLADRISPALTAEIDAFEAQIARCENKVRSTRKSSPKPGSAAAPTASVTIMASAMTAAKTQKLPYPLLTKGPDTFWDAPGMQRIKIPFGGLNPQQMMVLAELAEEYSDGICHITTRQDIQLHYVHIDDTPDLMCRLAAVGITTREACGNSIRNVTACPLAGCVPHRSV